MLSCSSEQLAKCIEMLNDIYITFIDDEKAFEKANHDLLMNDLEQMGIDRKDLRLLNNLYRDQVAAISINGQLSTQVPFENGVR